MGIVSYISYIWPNESILQGLIYFIVFIGIVVLAFSFYIAIESHFNLKILDEQNEKNLCDVSYLANTLLDDSVDTKEIFGRFEEQKGKDVFNKHLFEHIYAIYEAGHKSSRLDTDLLIKNTVHKVFWGTDFIKSLISLFLVFGILGTLLGLALSIGAFNGDSFLVDVTTKKTATELSNLFINLKGAFAPSMAGVSFTIFFVFLYTLVIQELCINKLATKLTTVTINNWIPSLYPTNYQKGEISMAKLDKSVREANEAREIHNKFVDESKAMITNMVETNTTIKELGNVSTTLRETSRVYYESALKISEVKDILTGISDELKQKDEDFRNFAREEVLNISKMHEISAEQISVELSKNDNLFKDIVSRNIGIIYKTQQDSLKALEESIDKNIKELKMCNKGFEEYVKGQITEIDNICKESSKNVEATEACLRISTQNHNQAVDKLNTFQNNIIESVTEPIKEQLAEMGSNIGRDLNSVAGSMENIANSFVSDVATPIENKLNEMNTNMGTGLNNIASSMDEIYNKLSGISNPMEKSAERIQAMVNDCMNEINRKNALLAEKGGISPEQAKLLTSSMNTNDKNEEISEKLDLIAKYLENISAQDKGKNDKCVFESRTMKIIERYIPLIMVGLLAAGLIVQGYIIGNRIDSLQQSIITQNLGDSSLK